MQITECTVEEIPALMRFIDQHWRSGHILSHERSVLDWYYGTPQGCTFLLAQQDGEISGVLGYIDSDRFYPKPPESSELWLALWKVREDVHSPGLGLRLILDLKRRYPKRSIAVLGLSDTASKIYGLLRYQVKTLDHLFIYNDQLDSYKILRGSPPALPYAPFYGEVELISKSEQLVSDENEIKDYRQRTASYFIKRYLANPFNTYLVFRIQHGALVSYVFGREMSAKGRKVLRLIDVYGQIPLLGAALIWFQGFLQKQEMEYMDLYVYCEETSILRQCGFLNREDHAGVVVPNYFEPFIAENIDLQCAMEDGFSGPVFKADGDQERPNEIN